MPSVLVVDDDSTVREVVASYLEQAGYLVTQAGDGEQALAAARHAAPDLVVLDLMLPRLDGMEVFRRLRARRGDLPVVMLTARGDESERVLGLEMGADDYVTKPFSARELVLRVQSVLRRLAVDTPLVPEHPAATPAQAGSGAPPRPTDDGPERLVDGELIVDRRARRVTRDGAALALTVREYDLLVYLMRHAGTAFTRADLMSAVWGWEYGDQSTVTVHVRRLREKVEPDPGVPCRLVTVWGVGYRWDGLSGPLR